MSQGRLIWCSEITETRHEIPGAWWGRYEYHASFAVLVAEHWTIGLRRISFRGEDITEKLRKYLKFYNGQQTEPDPTLNAAMDGNAPVYQNDSYVVFKDVPLIFFMDRIPLDLDFDLDRTVSTRQANTP